MLQRRRLLLQNVDPGAGGCPTERVEHRGLVMEPPRALVATNERAPPSSGPACRASTIPIVSPVRGQWIDTMSIAQALPARVTDRAPRRRSPPPRRRGHRPARSCRRPAPGARPRADMADADNAERLPANFPSHQILTREAALAPQPPVVSAIRLQQPASGRACAGDRRRVHAAWLTTTTPALLQAATSTVSKPAPLVETQSSFGQRAAARPSRTIARQLVLRRRNHIDVRLVERGPGARTL